MTSSLINRHPSVSVPLNHYYTSHSHHLPLTTITIPFIILSYLSLHTHLLPLSTTNYHQLPSHYHSLYPLLPFPTHASPPYYHLVHQPPPTTITLPSLTITYHHLSLTTITKQHITINYNQLPQSITTLPSQVRHALMLVRHVT